MMKCWRCSREYEGPAVELPLALQVAANLDFCPDCCAQSVVYGGQRSFVDPDLHETFRALINRMEGGPPLTRATVAGLIVLALASGARVGEQRRRNVP